MICENKIIWKDFFHKSVYLICGDLNRFHVELYLNITSQSGWFKMKGAILKFSSVCTKLHSCQPVTEIKYFSIF